MESRNRAAATMMGGVNSVQWRARIQHRIPPCSDDVGCVLVAITVHAPVFLFRLLRIITFPLHCAICHLTLSRNTFLLHPHLHLGYHMRTNCASRWKTIFCTYLTPRRSTLSNRSESGSKLSGSPTC